MAGAAEPMAWVTLATTDPYALGALVLAHSLRQAETAHQLVVMVTPGVTQQMRSQLAAVFDEVVSVDVLDSGDAAHLALLARPELGVTLTKLHCWTLRQYAKCVFLDADCLIMANCDELFEREELSAAPDVGWPDCFNSGVFVFSPNQETFSALCQMAAEQGSFDGGDQGLLNTYFSDWATRDISRHLPFLYNMTASAAYTYLPAFRRFGRHVKIVHFLGAVKPWASPESADPGSPVGRFHCVWWDVYHSHVRPGAQQFLETSVPVALQALPVQTLPGPVPASPAPTNVSASPGAGNGRASASDGTSSAGGGGSAASGGGTSARGEDTPAGGEDTPVMGEDTPVRGEDTPVRGEDTPARGEDTPAGNGVTSLTDLPTTHQSSPLVNAAYSAASSTSASVHIASAPSEEEGSRVQLSSHREVAGAGACDTPADREEVARAAARRSAECRRRWEEDRIDYMGADRFSNVWRRIESSLERATAAAAGGVGCVAPQPHQPDHWVHVSERLQDSVKPVDTETSELVSGLGGLQLSPASAEETARRAAWEQGKADYMGSDSFENILSKINNTLHSQQ